ncbi:Transcription factor bHLH11 [Hirschfeldia incana]|nr:Transcription factor bHLH11 [Hirschfeldia incana]
MEQTNKLKTSTEFSLSDESSSASSSSSSSIRIEKMVEVKEEPVSCRKVQKAGREKIRRDKLNEQFLELGNALDPTRPKSGKASILIDTIQTLKDLMTQVDRLKAEHVTLSQESREQLVQEKSELREEKTSLKSDIEILNAEYQHRVRTMVPWIPHYTYPVPLVAITQCPVSTLPFPFHGTLNPSPSPKLEQASSYGASNKQDCKIKSLDLDMMTNSNQSDKKYGVGLELELKIHASSSGQEFLLKRRNVTR